MNKFILHIPCKKYVGGQLVDNGYEKCIDAMVTSEGTCDYLIVLNRTKCIIQKSGATNGI